MDKSTKHLEASSLFYILTTNSSFARGNMLKQIITKIIIQTYSLNKIYCQVSTDVIIIIM